MLSVCLHSGGITMTNKIKLFGINTCIFLYLICFRYNIILSLKNPHFKFIILNIFLIINEINECSLRPFIIGRLLIYRLYQMNIYIVMLRYETKTQHTHMDICYWIYYDFKSLFKYCWIFQSTTKKYNGYQIIH